MTENEKIELFDKWYDENYDEWAEGEEGIALREELEQAFKGGIEALEEENAELKSGCGMCYRKDKEQLTKAKEIIKYLCGMVRELNKPNVQLTDVDYSLSEAEQFLKDSEVEKC